MRSLRILRYAGVLLALSLVLEGVLRCVPVIEAARIRGGSRFSLPAAVSLLGQTIEGTELANPLVIPAATQIDGGDGANASAWDIPRKTDCSGVTTEGRLCWDTDDNVLYIGNGSAAAAFAMLAGTQTITGAKTLTSLLTSSTGTAPQHVWQFGNATYPLRVAHVSSGGLHISANYNSVTSARDAGSGTLGNVLELVGGASWAIKFYNINNFGTFTAYWFDGSGNIALLTLAAPTRTIDIGGTTPRSIGMIRNGTAATQGQSLTINAGGAIAGTNNLDGGPLVLQPGISTGTGNTLVKVQTYSKASSSGSSDNALNDRYIVTGAKAVTDGTLTGIVDINIASNQMAGGTIFLTCEATNATEYQATTTQVSFAGVNKGGSMFCTGTELGADVAAVSTGTLTVAVDATTGTAKCTVRVNCDTSLATTTPRVTYQVMLNSSYAVTATPL